MDGTWESWWWRFKQRRNAGPERLADAPHQEYVAHLRSHLAQLRVERDRRYIVATAVDDQYRRESWLRIVGAIDKEIEFTERSHKAAVAYQED